MGVPLEALAAMSARSGPQPMRLPNGLTLWARCEWRSRDGHRGLHAAGTDPSPQRTSPEPPPQPGDSAVTRDCYGFHRPGIAHAYVLTVGNFDRVRRFLLGCALTSGWRTSP
jgi:hypothetical protein